MRPLLQVFLPLCIAYATALRWCWDVWNLPDGYYGHGMLVPPLMLWLVWLRRDRWRRMPLLPDRRGLWLLLPGLLLHLCGAALTIDSLSASSLLLTVPGALLLALGPARLRGQWPVVGLLLFCVPLPLFVTGRLAFELKELAVTWGLGLANLVGLGAVRTGALVSIPGQAEGLLVADPCGGLRSLLAMLTIAWCIAFFLGPRSMARRGGLLLAAAPIALLVNALRIAGICWTARWSGTAFAAGTGHDLWNAAAWVVDLGLLLALDALLSRRHPGGPVAGPEVALPAAAGRPLRAVPIALWLSAPLLLALSLYRPFGDSAGRAEALPAATGSFLLQRRFELTPRYRQLLGTDDAIWRSYRGPDGVPVYVVAVFHEANWKSVHPPDICIAGSNMVLVESGTAQQEVAGQRLLTGRILARERTSGRSYLSLFVYATRDFATGSYAGFFLHHAPRALVRASNAGLLLRVETYVDGGGRSAAEARCRALLAELLPAARRLLP